MTNDERYAAQQVRKHLESVTAALYSALDEARTLPRDDKAEALIDLLVELDRNTDDALFALDDVEGIPQGIQAP